MSSSAERSAGRQEERIRLGLIQYVTEHTVDQDYAWVSRHAPRTGGTRARVAAVVTLALFALLIFTAASQTTRNASSESRERADLVQQIENRRAGLDQRVARVRALTSTNERLQAALIASGSGTAAAAVRRLGASTGAVAVTGPGVVMVADDNPDADSDRERVLDKDLQRLVNGLWVAGADAISINGQRITTLTSIRQAGAAINVNYIPLRAPYRVLAIGDRNTLASRFADSTSGASWFDLVQQVGLRLRISTSDRLDVPASDRLVLRYAKQAKGGAS